MSDEGWIVTTFDEQSRPAAHWVYTFDERWQLSGRTPTGMAVIEPDANLIFKRGRALGSYPRPWQGMMYLWFDRHRIEARTRYFVGDSDGSQQLFVVGPRGEAIDGVPYPTDEENEEEWPDDVQIDLHSGDTVTVLRDGRQALQMKADYPRTLRERWEDKQPSVLEDDRDEAAFEADWLAYRARVLASRDDLQRALGQAANLSRELAPMPDLPTFAFEVLVDAPDMETLALLAANPSLPDALYARAAHLATDAWLTNPALLLFALTTPDPPFLEGRTLELFQAVARGELS